ncbi:MAG: UMP kinase [Candidatus Methanofastidiosia archaeon]
MRVVLRVGGSILRGGDKTLENLTKGILSLKKKHQVILEVGGGNLSRTYIKLARRFGVSETKCDYLGIKASRLNAMLLISLLGEEAYQEVIQDFREIPKALALEKIPVLAGTHPGHTNDAVAAMACEFARADLLLKITDVDGIYDRDPKKFKNAKKIKKISFEELESFQNQNMVAGISSVLDPLASNIIMRSRIKTIVIGEREMKNLLRVIDGKHSGTLIG